jgi:DNA-binding response OmpR family regulator
MENSQEKSHLILIVDDDPMNVEILQYALEEDYEIGIALNGEDALDFAREKHPHLILLDILMPDMDGYEVMRRLKDSPQTRDIAVIFITALDEMKKKIKGFELGAVDYIPKPFTDAEVIARVKTHLALIDYRERLEEKVLERTEALEKAHLKLQKMEGLLASVQTASLLKHEIDSHLNTIVECLSTSQPPEKSLSEINSISALISEMVEKVSQAYDTFTETEPDLSPDGAEGKEF